MKKIFLFYPKIFPVLRGDSVHGYNLVKELYKSGVKIFTLSIGQKESEYYETIKTKNPFKILKSISRCDYVYYRIGPFTINKVDILLFIVPKNKKIIENNTPPEELISEEKLKKIPKRFITIFRYKINKASRIVCVSNVLRESLIKDHNIKAKKITVVPNGCNPEKFSAKYQKRTFLSEINNKIKVFWAGNPNWKFQNFDKLLEIVKKMEYNKNILFVLGGIDIINSNLKNVIFLPKISYHHISQFIMDSDILLAFYGDYKWSPIGFYISSLKFFDYMASGKPVIAPNLGQIREIAKHKENAMLYNNYDEIITFIDQLGKDSGLRKVLGENANALMEKKYTWKNSIEKIISIM